MSKKFLSDVLIECGLQVDGTTTLGTATATTVATSDNSTNIATTAWVKALGYSTTDSFISDVSLSGSTLSFTGINSAFTGSIDLSGITSSFNATDVRTVYERVKNVSGGLLPKGTPLAVVPGQTSGNISDVVPADASDPTLMPAIFILNEDLDNEIEGEAVAFGNITGIDTSLYDSGTTVYVAPGGGWTADKPQGNNLIQNLGIITKSHSTNGGGVVMGAGRSNDVPNISQGYAWVGNANGVATPTLLGSLAYSSATYDNYVSWNLKTNGVQRTTVQSGGNLDIVAGTNVSVSYGAGGVVTISSTDTNTDTNNYLTGLSFNTSNGVLTATRQGLGDLTVDLDGRYLTSYAETDTLATVTARGATTSTAVTFESNVTLGNSADLVFSDTSGTFPTSGKGFDWTLNNDGARIYAMQPSSDAIDFVFQLRDNATTNDRFVFHVKEWQGAEYDKYPLIIRAGTQFDLVDSALYVRGTQVISNARVLSNVSGNISMFTNDAGYLTSFTETDPIFSAHVSAGITGTQISNWDTAHSWGDHSAEGYLTSETLTELSLTTNILSYRDETGAVTELDLSLYLDDTNLARLTSGTLNGSTGIATFTRDDSSTFTVDFSAFLADGNNYVDSLAFSTSTGILTLGRNGSLSDLTVDLDGRYLTGLPASTGTLTKFTNSVTIESNSDGILNLKQTDAGSTPGTKEGGWNYIQFLDGQGDRQAYFGIDSQGNLEFNPEVAGAVIQMNRSMSTTGTVTASGGNSNNWNTAYNWGDHSAQGYLTSYTETDTLNTVTGRGAITSNAITTGAHTITGSHSVITSAERTAGDPAAVVLEAINTASYYGAFIDYVIHDGSRDSQRAGTLTVTWNQVEIRFSETATMDIGDTSVATLDAVINGSNADIRFTAPDPTWEIKYTLRLL